MFLKSIIKQAHGDKTCSSKIWKLNFHNTFTSGERPGPLGIANHRPVWDWQCVIVACCSFVFVYTYECVFINYLRIISLYIVKRVSQFKHNNNQTCVAQKDAQNVYCLLFQVRESIVVEIGPRNLYK